MTSPSSERTRIGALVEWFGERPIPPVSCYDCTALLVCLASPRVDHLGQLHLDDRSALGVELSRLRGEWFLSDLREYRAYTARGEWPELRALRDLYEHGPRWVWWIPGMVYGDYVPEFDGCPFVDDEGLDSRPDWFAPCAQS